MKKHDIFTNYSQFFLNVSLFYVKMNMVKIRKGGIGMRTMIFGAGTDLGVHIDGASLGPVQLMNDLKSFYKGESILFEQDKDII